MDYLGHRIQPHGGKLRNSDGRILNMWNVGETLILTNWKDKDSPWRQDEFVISSVTKKADSRI